jgi:hypothetical protein
MCVEVSERECEGETASACQCVHKSDDDDPFIVLTFFVVRA